MLGICRRTSSLIGEQEDVRCGCAVFSGGYAVFPYISVDASLFVAVLPFSGGEGDLEVVKVLNSKFIHTWIISQQKSFIKEPVRCCASAASMCSICPGVGCSGRLLVSTSGSTSSSLQSSCFVLNSSYLLFSRAVVNSIAL